MATSITTLEAPPSQKLNKLVQIRKRTDVPLGDSDLGQVFSDPKPRWARIQPVGTAVYAEGQQTDHAITHRIWLRKIAGITTAHEVVHKESLYRVLRSADLDGGNAFTILEVEQLQ
ncbi:head-tail adaptor protein [Comamonas terrigena]|uniref:Head-tail adaptor protein n=1 Tax=Comamonas terrigena TaxID=32013 RepID=A0A2A7UXI9_COMTR|nr:head-tail adaptor protein [Comamonas terrigena]PEH90069.1 head-tail adaptor protein [Comamonas terrigena]BBL25360.1 hypothetical protein CT3_28150 [Comamonas terrigena NBRC 13299]SUY71062.1 Bacteriophage head-tail adaptor [Comamonas terrigena]